MVIFPILLLIVDSQLLSCNGEFKFLSGFLLFFDTLFELVPLLAYFSIPLGIVLLLGTYWLWRRTKGVTKTVVTFEILGLILLIVIVCLVVLASFNSTRIKGPNSHVMSLLSQLRAEAEIYYVRTGTYSGLCLTDQNYITVQEEIQTTIFDHGLLCSKLTGEFNCMDSDQAYAVSTKLQSIEANAGQKYFCVDSTGFAGEVDKPITKTGCK